ncbi:MAG TPA: RNA polymerase subunit sigma-70, partial [Amycolatopsis sp.]|nr:RNA polymerase subunit sigma-70 [Amycolatopsis sp.]
MDSVESDLLEAARRDDEGAFDRLVAPYRGELHAHCYRMLGAVHDAEDALQEALVGAWRGLAGFEGRSSVRSWLYRIATNACLKLIKQQPKRLVPLDYHAPMSEIGELAPPIEGEFYVEPYADPQATYELRESVELAFIAALQHLPGTQRAVLILRDVLAFSAAEVAEALDTSVASVNSALQRARKTLDERTPAESQQATLRRLGEEAEQKLVAEFVAAWERGDVPALLELLAEDARFTMPPLPAWFDGRENVARFLAERVFATPWRLVPASANGQLAFACYQQRDGEFRIGCLNVLTLRGAFAAVTKGTAPR